MPLETSKSKEALGRNIAREREAGKPEKQAIAIAFSKQREAEARDNKNSYARPAPYMGGTQAAENIAVTHKGNNPLSMQPYIFNPACNALSKFPKK